MNAGSPVLRRIGLALALLLVAFALGGGALSVSAGKASSPAALDVPTRFEGYLKAIGPEKWLIGDRSVLVDGNTLLVEKRGKAEIGAWVIVWGRRDQSGGVHAELIQVDRPAGRPGAGREFTGVVRKIAGDSWIIEQTLVEVTAATTLIGEPRLGSLVWVVCEFRGDSYRATVIETISPDPTVQPVEFKGVIESFDAQSWTMDGHHLIITRDTDIVGDPQVGKTAEVRAQPGTGNDLIALTLRVVDSASEARLSAMVTAIAANRDGSETWEVVVFPKTTDELPVTRALQITGHTLVDESRAVAQSGQWIEVTGAKTGDDTYQADVVRLERPAPVILEGELTPLSTKPGARGWWLLNGQLVWWLPDSARAAASFGDDPVSVSGVRLGNGVIWVKQIHEAQSQGR